MISRAPGSPPGALFHHPTFSRVWRQRYALARIVFGAVAVSSSASASRRTRVCSHFAENDLFQPGGRSQDRNYTGGFGFRFTGSFVEDAHLDAPLRGLDRLTGSAKKHDASGQHFHTLLIFGTAYTPDNLNTPVPVLDDRPYGSLVGASVRRLSVKGDRAWSSELAIAMLGLPVARNLQTFIHRRLRARSGDAVPYDPLGWHNQISDGGEPTALYRVAHERRLLGDASKHFELTGGFAASAGYYTNLTALLNARAGWFTSEFWEFTPGAMDVGNQRVSAASRRPSPRWELFVFAGARPRLNLYNALLQGQFRDSVHTVELERGVLEWDLGIGAFIPFLRTQLTWNMRAGRTPEFEGGQPRAHTWGSVVATYAVPMPRR